MSIKTNKMNRSLTKNTAVHPFDEIKQHFFCKSGFPFGASIDL